MTTRKHTVGRYELILTSLDWSDAAQELMLLGRKIIAENPKPIDKLRADYFNFFCSTSGLKGSAIAKNLRVPPSAITKWRKGESRIDDSSWTLIRLFFDDVFANGGEITNAIFKSYSDEELDVGSPPPMIKKPPSIP